MNASKISGPPVLCLTSCNRWHKSIDTNFEIGEPRTFGRSQPASQHKKSFKKFETCQVHCGRLAERDITWALALLLPLSYYCWKRVRLFAWHFGITWLAWHPSSMPRSFKSLDSQNSRSLHSERSQFSPPRRINQLVSFWPHFLQ